MHTVFYEVFFISDKQLFEFAKFRGSRGIVGLVSSCHRTFVSISWVQYFFKWVFRGFKKFSRGQFRNFQLLAA